MRSLRAMGIVLAEPEDLVNMQDRPFLCKKVGLMNLGGRTLAAADPGGSGIGPQRALEANTQSPRAQRESSTFP